VTITAGIDVGSTYTKAIVQSDEGEILGKAFGSTGFKLREVARSIYDEALGDAGVDEAEVAYVIATGAGRHQVDFKDLHVTDLTASARGACRLFPGSRSGSTTNALPAPVPSWRRQRGTWDTPHWRSVRS